MDNIVFVPRENLINSVRLIIHIGGDFFHIRHTTSTCPSITGYFLDTMQVVVVIVYALVLANAMLYA
jgi:hypothetical protein